MSGTAHASSDFAAERGRLEAALAGARRRREDAERRAADAERSARAEMGELVAGTRVVIASIEQAHRDAVQAVRQRARIEVTEILHAASVEADRIRTGGRSTADPSPAVPDGG